MEGVRYTIDMKGTVILLGYPDLDKDFSFCGKSQGFDTYGEFMNAHGYELKSNGTYRIPSGTDFDTQKEIEKVKHDDLDALILTRAAKLIKANTRKGKR